MNPTDHQYQRLPDTCQFEGIVGLAIVALIFAACWGVERLVHRSNPNSGKFFWWGSVIGAVAGSLFLVGFVVLGNHTSSFLSDLPWMLFSGAIMGSMPGGIVGLAIGWIWPKVKKQD